MRQVILELPTLAFVIGTRAALAAGVGLLATAGLAEDRRRKIGWQLVAIGAVTTLPAALSLVRGARRSQARRAGTAVQHDPSLVGAARFPRKGDDDVLPPLWDAADLDETLEFASTRR